MGRCFKDRILVFSVVFLVLAMFFLQKECQDTYSLALTLQKEVGELKKCRSDIDNNELTELQKEQTYLSQQISKLTEEQAKLSGGFEKVQKLALHLEKLTELQREKSPLSTDEIKNINNEFKDLGSIRGENESEELPINNKTETQQVQQGTWTGFACFILTSTFFIICTLGAVLIVLLAMLHEMDQKRIDTFTKIFIAVTYVVLSVGVIGNGCYYRLYSDQHDSWIGFASFSIMVLLTLGCGFGAVALCLNETWKKLSYNGVEVPCQIFIMVLIVTFVTIVIGNGFYYHWYYIL